MNEPMSLREAAAELNLQVDTLRKYAERGKIPAKKVGQKWCLPKAWVDDEKKVREQPLWVKERAQPEEQAPSKVGEIDSLLQEQRIQHQHIKSVLILLEAYVSQLREPYEPEDFVTPPGKEALSQKEFDYWYYAKRAIPSLEVFIDSQIDSESLAITAKLESEPSFTALKDHYKSSKLWQDIERYKRLRGQYWSIGFKLHRTIMELCSGPFAEETKAEVLRNAIREWLNEELAPIRVKLQLEGIIDKNVVLNKLPSSESMSLRLGKELLEKYLSNARTNRVEEARLFGGLVELLGRLEEAYETLRRLEKCLIIGVEEEKLKGRPPVGTKYKFCPAV